MKGGAGLIADRPSAISHDTGLVTTAADGLEKGFDLAPA